MIEGQAYIRPEDVEFEIETSGNGRKDIRFERQGRRWHLMNIPLAKGMKSLLTPDDDETKVPWPHHYIRTFEGVEIDTRNACLIIDLVYSGFHQGIIQGQKDQAATIRRALNP